MSHIILGTDNKTYDLSTQKGCYEYIAHYLVEKGAGSQVFSCLTQLYTCNQNQDERNTKANESEYEKLYVKYFDAFQLLNTENQALKEKLRIAKEALEKYGETDFVVLCEETKEYHIDEDIKKDLNCPWRYYSGEIARQALKEIEK